MLLHTNNLAETRLAYLAEREARRATDAEAAAVKGASQAKAYNERMQPLSTRLVRFLANMPPQVQRDGVTMITFTANMAGKHGGHANAPDVGAELRLMGWVRQRVWLGASASYGAVWRPPLAPTAASLTPASSTKEAK